MSHRREQKDAKKEERRMEAEAKEYREGFDPNTASDGEYYSCSWMQQHSPHCHETPDDHPAKEYNIVRLHGDPPHEVACETVDKWDVAIAFENMRWADANINPGGVQHDVFSLDVAMTSIIEILIDELGVTYEKLNTVFKRKKLEKLRTQRELILPAVEEQRRQQLISRVMPGGMLGPNGEVMQ